MKNPFKTGTRYFGVEQQWCDAESRIAAVKKFTLKECHAALAVRGLQKTVRAAIGRRIRAVFKEFNARPPLAERGTCRNCKCTDQRACAGGCYWVVPPRGRKRLGLCSRCLEAYFSLPAKLKFGLTRTFSEGYAENYAEACDWLKQNQQQKPLFAGQREVK